MNCVPASPTTLRSAPPQSHCAAPPHRPRRTSSRKSVPPNGRVFQAYRNYIIPTGENCVFCLKKKAQFSPALGIVASRQSRVLMCDIIFRPSAPTFQHLNDDFLDLLSHIGNSSQRFSPRWQRSHYHYFKRFFSSCRCSRISGLKSNLFAWGSAAMTMRSNSSMRMW